MLVTAIVLAAGAGRRIGGAVSKAYLPIAGRPLVLRTLDRIFAARTVAKVILVVAGNEFERCNAMLRADSVLRSRPCVLQSGGATRQQSAKRGLEKIGAETDMVMIHDGARPFVSVALIDRLIEAAVKKDAVVAGLPVRDTIKVVGSGRLIHSTPHRGALWEIQTPQVFKRELIVAAHEAAEKNGLEATDDAMVVERFGKPVYVLEGERTNFKITLPEDVWLAEMMIREGRVP
ncbi:MAG: 2-C-methyl-D-erythritol 4-phosphate cytidylyltransferase [Deltaproteobacteria bacterium]|nr:2-C-methyl-D-erythritol 4-phosphate cytidylyltransferase [Deltaproteobacteria bacterium]